MVFQQCINYTSVPQIDQIVLFDVLFNLTALDGSNRTAQAQGKGDSFSYS
ncbi:Uncharacterised protein [uncultured archaeon]|nr:Uncharacterised protein [uncultured archaeon]